MVKLFYKDIEICPENIVKIRTILKLTATELAVKLGISTGNVQNWEKCRFGISDKHKIKILKLLEENEKTNDKQNKINHLNNLKEQLSNLTLIELQKLFKELELEVIIK